jgi:DNA-binding response OmpR family regulator
MQHPDDVLDRGTIMQEVWETNFLGDTRTLDVHIRWLREKLEKDPSHPQHIVTVRGVGYRFYPEPQAGSEDREQL